MEKTLKSWVPENTKKRKLKKIFSTIWFFAFSCFIVIRLPNRGEVV